MDKEKMIDEIREKVVEAHGGFGTERGFDISHLGDEKIRLADILVALSHEAGKRTGKDDTVKYIDHLYKHIFHWWNCRQDDLEKQNPSDISKLYNILR
jgi:hypothetical protein